jgi:predicted MPP superfamily phosphohydrolase
MPKQFIIGDIHGCYKTLVALIEEELMPSKSDTIYFLGDYIGKGPDSKSVVKYIMSLINEGFNVRCLMGNHERMLLDSLLSDKQHYKWLWNGGSECLRSFNVYKAKDIKKKYIKFFTNLEYYIELDEFILVHGGLNFNASQPLLDKKSMLWTRNQHIDKSKTNGKRLIVGHTPVKFKRIKRTLSEDLIMLDGGCVYSKVKEKQGNLVALELNEMKLYKKYNIDM